jgi:uncharacterized HAD superfamily protein
MNIGIDIDGVLTDLERFAFNYGCKYNVEEGIKTNINPEKYWEEEKFNWNSEQEEKFWNRYLEGYIRESKVREFAGEIIKNLHKEGHKIYIITARNESGLPQESYGKMQEMTKQWLNQNEIEYDEIIFANDSEKLNQCKINNIDLMIEDSPNNILNISQEIPVIKYDSQYNKNAEGKNIITAYGWYQIYEIIKEIEAHK